MPMPITPLHTQEAYHGDHTPDDSYIQLQGLSSLQSLMIGPEPVREAAKKYDYATLETLERIAECEDDFITIAAQQLALKSASTASTDSSYRVPQNIDDNTLLGLKAQGLVVGQGRVVSLTKAGKVALRDKWLKQPNQLKENRASERFDLEKAKKKLITSSDNGKFVKTSQTQPDNYKIQEEMFAKLFDRRFQLNAYYGLINKFGPYRQYLDKYKNDICEEAAIATSHEIPNNMDKFTDPNMHKERYLIRMLVHNIQKEITKIMNQHQDEQSLDVLTGGKDGSSVYTNTDTNTDTLPQFTNSLEQPSQATASVNGKFKRV